MTTFPQAAGGVSWKCDLPFSSTHLNAACAAGATTSSATSAADVHFIVLSLAGVLFVVVTGSLRRTRAVSPAHRFPSVLKAAPSFGRAARRWGHPKAPW